VDEYPDCQTEYIQSPEMVSTRKLAKKWDIPYPTIADRCKREGWVEQRKQFHRKVIAKSEDVAAETLAEARARWAKEYRTLQAKGLKALGGLEPRSAGEAARLLDLGIKGERLQREEDNAAEMPQTLRDLILLLRGEEPIEE
jgi:hypothetical protein